MNPFHDDTRKLFHDSDGVLYCNVNEESLYRSHDNGCIWEESANQSEFAWNFDTKCQTPTKTIGGDLMNADDFYKNEGMAIFIKGKMVLGVYPDNLENNLNALATDDMKIDWRAWLSYIERDKVKPGEV